MIGDYELILASFQSQYGIRLSRELKTMTWKEFKAMLSGLGPKTPLGQIVTVRLETDPKIIKNFTPHQRWINSEWQTRRAKSKSEAEVNDALEQIKQAFIRMAGGGDTNVSDSRPD